MMFRVARYAGAVLCAAAVLTSVAAGLDAGRQPPTRRAVIGGVVFVGGYFYDPFYGPYPWWSRAAYPYPYYPVYDTRAEVRILVTPKDGAVYVDGFYAGVVEDFNGFFHHLPLPPGDHDIITYEEGFRTVHNRVYLAPDSTITLEYAMVSLPAGERSERPRVMPAVPPPPVDTYTTPGLSRRPPLPPTPR